MGTRINYKLYADDSDTPVVTLLSNNSHGVEDPERLFREAVNAAPPGVNALTEKLLGLRYESDGGTHRAGERMFWLNPCPGKSEAAVKARVGLGHEQLPVWSVITVPAHHPV